MMTEKEEQVNREMRAAGRDGQDASQWRSAFNVSAKSLMLPGGTRANSQPLRRSSVVPATTIRPSVCSTTLEAWSARSPNEVVTLPVVPKGGVEAAVAVVPAFGLHRDALEGGR
jgi:hypothetical protein